MGRGLRCGGVHGGPGANAAAAAVAAARLVREGPAARLSRALQR
jgi:hypothetical protein